MSDNKPAQQPIVPRPGAAPPTGPVTLQLTRADHPGPEIQKIWIVVDHILVIHPTSPNTPVGTAIWVAQQQAFIVSETVDQVLYLMGAQVEAITGAALQEVEARVTLPHNT